MNKLTRYMALILIGLSSVLGTGCGKKTAATPEAVDGAPKLPGADDVMAAIEKKDYDGAVAALLKVGRTVANEEQQMQYMALSRRAREKLSEAATTDPKAAEALTNLRPMTM